MTTDFSQEEFDQMKEVVLEKFIAEQGHIFELKVAGDLKTILKMGNFRVKIFFTENQGDFHENNIVYCQIDKIKLQKYFRFVTGKSRKFPKEDGILTLTFYSDNVPTLIWYSEKLYYATSGKINFATIIHKIVIY